MKSRVVVFSERSFTAFISLAALSSVVLSRAKHICRSEMTHYGRGSLAKGRAGYPRISPLTEKKQKEDSLMDNKNVEAKVVQLKTQLVKEGHTRHLLAETDLWALRRQVYASNLSMFCWGGRDVYCLQA
jgi:pimeloyl-CoA synthetase